ncbi:MAG TPA: hypothetical protein VGR06_00820 [Actinophytocola sp.]|jgi:hypothetical protein|uniref:hypothetical protein n=1 Tax=Actinophytocola sp. TaxID=1872138 RepID=UPI002DF7714F|nr:hypothetical protein [Actinophytocola sp.]
MPGIQYYAFVGTPADVAVRLYQLPKDVVADVFYTLLVQGDELAGIHVFTRAAAGDREGIVHAWEGASLDTLPDRVLALALSAEPGPALREKIHTLLRDHGEFADLGVVPCPPTPRGAFGHPIRPYAAGGTIRAIVVAA